MKKCRKPVKVTDHISMRGDTRKSMRHIYPYCEYLIPTTEKCKCPYDYCIMNPEISLKEDK